MTGVRITVQDNIIGIAMQLDVSDLKSGLAETRKAITTANKEFKASTAGMDDWKNSVEGLKAKLKQLDTTLTMQKKNLAGYEAELERVSKEKGETSEEARKLKDKILDVQAAIGKTEKELRNYKSKLDDVESETKDADKATDKMSSAMRDAKSATKELDGGFTVLKGAMANLVATGISNVVSGLKDIVSESREFRTEMSYLQSTADDTGVSFDHAKDKVKDVYSILGETDSAVEGLNNLMTAGFDGDQLDQITDHLVGASIKWHDTLKFEGLSDGLQETLATGKAIGPFVELLERGGLNAEEFDEGLAKCTTEAEKQNYVLQTLSKLGLSDITESHREANKELVEGAEAQFEYEEAMAEVGAKAEPVLTTIKQGWVDVLGAFMDSADGMDTAELQTTIKDAFQWFIDKAVPALKEGFKFIKDNIQPIAIGIGLIGAAWATWKTIDTINKVVEGLGKFKDILKVTKKATDAQTASTLKTTIATKAHTIAEKARAIATNVVAGAQKLLNLVMSANPIGLIITAIVALIAIFAVLWNKCDWFREFWINLWDTIVQWCGQAWEAIKGFFSSAWEWIKQAWASAVEWFGNIWSGIKGIWSEVTAWFGNLFTSAKQTVENIWSGIVGFFEGIWNGIKAVFSFVVEYYRTLFTLAKQAVEIVWSGVVSIFQNAWNGIKLAWSNVTTFFQNIWNGIKLAFSNVGAWFLERFNTAKNAIVNTWSTVTGFFSNIWTGIKNIFANIGTWFSEKFNLAKNMVQQAWSGIVGFFSNIWTGIKNVFSTVSKWFGEKFRTAKTAVQNAWSSVVSFFRGIWNKIKSAFSTVASTLGGFFRSAWSNIQSAWSGVTNWFSSIVDKIVNFFKGIPDKLKQIGKDMMNGLKDGITSKIDSIKNTVKDVKDKVVGWFEDFFHMGSPSKLMRDEVGKMIGEGVGVGLLDSAKGVLKDVDEFSKKVSKGFDVTLGGGLNGTAMALNAQGAGGTNVTNNYTQVINAPKSPSRSEIYRQTKNLLSKG